MNKKQILSILTLWLFTIGTFGGGFAWLVSSVDCDLKRQHISRITDIQDNFLLSFGVFGSKEKLPELKAVIENREGLIKQEIEYFKETCRSSREKKQLISILRQYSIYLSMKQAVLHEKQDFSWHQSLFPKELAFKNF